MNINYNPYSTTNSAYGNHTIQTKKHENVKNSTFASKLNQTHIYTGPANSDYGNHAKQTKKHEKVKESTFASKANQTYTYPYPAGQRRPYPASFESMTFKQMARNQDRGANGGYNGANPVLNGIM